MLTAFKTYLFDRTFEERKWKKLERHHQPSTMTMTSTTILNTSDIKVTQQTICKTLHREALRKIRARKVPLLAKRHVDARIKYANELINKEQDYFSNILWSDECKVELFGNDYTSTVWSKSNDAYLH